MAGGLWPEACLLAHGQRAKTKATSVATNIRIVCRHDSTKTKAHNAASPYVLLCLWAIMTSKKSESVTRWWHLHVRTVDSSSGEQKCY